MCNQLTQPFAHQRLINIDRTTYDKAAKYPAVLREYRNAYGAIYRRECRGYEQRIGKPPTRWVIHTTNGKKGSSFAGEARFLLDNPYAATDKPVSAHYLVGKQGQVVRFLRPDTYVAWCVGTSALGWNNFQTINVECHLTRGETFTVAMKDALTRLLLEGSYAYGIDLGNATNVETHRAIATPLGRKVDPSGWDDDHFYEWRGYLSDTLWPEYREFLRA